MVIEVTRIGGDGSIRRAVVDTAGRDDAARWERLAQQAALEVPPPYRPEPGQPVYHGDDQDTALEEQRNGEWRYLEFLQVTSWITADLFMREIPGGTRARHRSRPVDLPEHRY
jgi:hypothetical protein